MSFFAQNAKLIRVVISQRMLPNMLSYSNNVVICRKFHGQVKMVSDPAIAAERDWTAPLRRIIERYAGIMASGKVTLGLGTAAVLAGVTTYLAISETTPFNSNPRVILGLLLLDLGLLLALAILVAWRLVALWMARRSGATGSRLHLRMVAMFGVVAITPTIIMAVYSTLILNLGFQAWFSEPVARVISASVSVAEAYVEEHRQVIRADILAMANDLNRALPVYYQDRARFSELVNQQAGLRSLADAYVITSSNEILAQSRMSFTTTFAQPSQQAMARAAEGEVVVLASERDSQVRALFRLDRFLDAYLYVSRYVDPRVLNTAMQAQHAASQYQTLEGQRGSIQIAFALIYLVLAMLVLLAAIALGFWLANRLVEPIGRLMAAAERVRSGDLSARVEEGSSDDEIGALGRAFNRMTGQLEGQRGELVGANLQLDRRRRFTEAVLEGVTSGVVGLDEWGCVNLANGAALTLLGNRGEDLMGVNFESAVPEMRTLLADARTRTGGRTVEAEIVLSAGDVTRQLLVRVARVLEVAVPEHLEARANARNSLHQDRERSHYVVTFDDISELMSAQRIAAWADVARRIAHEIKNPLTPIQLSAERLRRKYASEIVTDPEVFNRCVDTITRQVRDIGRLVDEFSSFARMPAPVLREENLIEIIRQAVFQQQLTARATSIRFIPPDTPVMLMLDRAQITQALVNIIKNAIEAIDVRKNTDPGDGKILIRLDADNMLRTVLSVIDNGCGLPKDARHRLTEPYVTTRDRGTGLGLAIVRKITEDHGARINLSDVSEIDSPEELGVNWRTGAVVQLVFPQSGLAQDATDAPNVRGQRI